MTALEKMLHHPFTYLTWGTCILALYLLHLLKKTLGPDYDKTLAREPWGYMVTFVLFSVCMFGLIHLSIKFGDVVLRDIGLGRLASE